MARVKRKIAHRKVKSRLKKNTAAKKKSAAKVAGKNKTRSLRQVIIIRATPQDVSPPIRPSPIIRVGWNTIGNRCNVTLRKRTDADYLFCNATSAWTAKGRTPGAGLDMEKFRHA